MQGHGEDDPVIKLEWARRAAEVLRPRSESLEFKTYKGVGHMISDMQVNEKRAGYVVQKFRKVCGLGCANSARGRA